MIFPMSYVYPTTPPPKKNGWYLFPIFFHMSPLQNDGWIGKVNFQGAILNFRSVGCGCIGVVLNKG